MTEGEFIEEIKKRAAAKLSEGLLSVESLEFAIGYRLKRGGPFTDSMAADCLRLADHFETFRSNLSRDETDEEPEREPALAVDALLLGEAQRLATEARACLLRVREKLFGNPRAPFASCKESVEWLQEAKQRSGEEGGLIEIPVPSSLKPGTRVPVSIGVPGGARGVEWVSRSETYWFEETSPEGAQWKEWLDHREIFKDPPHKQLKTLSLEIAEATGFTPAWVVAHLLYDLPPILPAIEIQTSSKTYRLPDGSQVSRQQAVATLSPFGLTRDGAKALVREIRQRFRINEIKATSEQLLLWLEGIIESIGAGWTWADAFREWNDRGYSVKAHYKNADVLRVTYGRLKEARAWRGRWLKLWDSGFWAGRVVLSGNPLGGEARIRQEDKMRFLITIERDEEGYYVAECPAIPGCVSQGGTEEEALENIKDAVTSCLEARRSLGLPLTTAIKEIEVEALV